jgi:hypothetical protein
MNKNHSAVSTTVAPMGADPIRDFMNTIPQKALVLGLKGYRTAERSAIYLVYSLNGSTFETSFSTKGGSVWNV